MLTLACAASAVLASAQTQPKDGADRTETREQNLRAYSELLRSDIRTQKVALITEMMSFTEEEDKAFWPIYREYENELRRLNDERLELIEKYAANYASLTDAQADQGITKALDLESRRTALKQTYFAKLKTALSPRVAARALHIEQQLDLLVDLQVAASLPIASPK